MVKKTVCLILAIVMVSSMLTLTAFADGEKYTEETTKEGWIKVINEDGATLGYSPDSGVTIIEDDGYAFKDSNRNGELDPYEDWRLDVETRAEDLAAQVPLDMIPGLMLLSTEGGRGQELTDAWKASIEAGSRTYDGNATVVDTAVANSNAVQAFAESLDFGIPVEFHAETGGGMSVTVGGTWPEPLAVGASFKPEIAQAVGAAKSLEDRSVGITTVNSPQIDLATEPRWSRIAGTFTEDPQLAMDMAQAYVTGLQSTFDEDGNDLGWGSGSVNATLKHFPGDGTAESGREAHNDYGKYNVYPGDNFYTQLLPFQAALELDSATGGAAAVMPDYGIGLDENGDPIGDDRVASGFNSYTITDILRDEMGYDGLVVTDYDIVNLRGWGLEDATEAERVKWIIAAGCDKIGSYGDIEVVKEGFQMYEDEVGAEAAEERYRESARRIFRNMIQIGLLDNPYLEASVAKDICGDKDRAAAAEEAMKECVVMLKNANGVIQERSEKPTVYIPLEYSPAVVVGEDSSGSSSDSPASANLPVDVRTLSEYFNVVTDDTPDASEYTGPEDEDGNPTLAEEDIIRRTEEEVKACDFTLIFISSPSNDGGGFDSETGTYIPISLQYGPYTADSIYVRQQSIGGDLQTVEVQDTYGAQMITTPENRSYYGNSAKISNADVLDKVAYAASVSDHVVAVVTAGGPMIFSEIEPDLDGIILSFGGISDDAKCAIVGGQFEPQALLPIQMPANMDTVEMQYEDVPRDMDCYVDSEGNTYDFAFGLNWSGVIDDERVAKYSVDPLEE